MSAAIQVDAHNAVVAHVTPTTPEERAVLARLGFTHVTGLRTQYPGQPAYVIRAREVERGSFGRNNSWEAAVTPGGEVWIRPWQKNLPSVSDLDHDLGWLRQAANKDFTPTVPCSNGEQIQARGLLARAFNPAGSPTSDLSADACLQSRLLPGGGFFLAHGARRRVDVLL